MARNLPRTAFKPGQSGNPGGRPAVLKEVQELAREHTNTAISTLVAIATDESKPAAARVSASIAILDRGYGKTPQTIDVRPTRSLVEMTDAELEEIIRRGQGD